VTPRELDTEVFEVLIKFSRSDNRSKVPVYQQSGDAAVDLCSIENAVLPPLGRRKIRTGVSVEIPSPFCGLILPRSGLTVKHGLTVLNSPGLIDSNYRGEIMVVLYNADPKEKFRLVNGARIAQLLILETPLQIWNEVEYLDESNRGENGFGSTGE
jgi:dUTP pyrophosphatase